MPALVPCAGAQETWTGLWQLWICFFFYLLIDCIYLLQFQWCLNSFYFIYCEWSDYEKPESEHISLCFPYTSCNLQSPFLQRKAAHFSFSNHSLTFPTRWPDGAEHWECVFVGSYTKNSSSLPVQVALHPSDSNKVPSKLTLQSALRFLTLKLLPLHAITSPRCIQLVDQQASSKRNAF